MLIILCNAPNVLPGCRAQLSFPLPSPVLILALEASRTGQLTSVLKSPTPLPLPLPLARVPRHGRRGHEPSSPPTLRTTCGHEQSHHHRRPNLELSQCLGFPASTSTRHRLCSLWRLPVAPSLRLSFGD
ncbi:uncharacterized protein LOC120690124 isoform X2 [Panicum virgatum]|uniref:uncharacterized protein LOC120690124 isoform X2 n=1 Tax=Panicum virgatum TaxID=38727 RepID=UPI0019D60DB2|nr:uncharacterized protein LOC120690124 isoform X2 [Panicum virgatum]